MPINPLTLQALLRGGISPNNPELNAHLKGVQDSAITNANNIAAHSRATSAQMVKGGQDRTTLAKKQELDQAQNQKDLQTLEDLIKGNPDSAVRAGQYSVSPRDPMLAEDRRLNRELRTEQFKSLQDRDFQNRNQKLASEYGKFAEATAMLRDIDRVTNRDGKGGILTNPNATLISGGKIKNKVSPSVLGAASLIQEYVPGVGNTLPSSMKVDPAEVDERKVLQRFINQYSKAMGGTNLTKLEAQRINDGVGMVASGDPDLLLKGIRSLAESHQEKLRTIGVGYSPDVLEETHKALGYDPGRLFTATQSQPAIPKNTENQTKLPSYKEWKKAKAEGSL